MCQELIVTTFLFLESRVMSSSPGRLRIFIIYAYVKDRTGVRLG
jgi:hypothetical protein